MKKIDTSSITPIAGMPLKSGGLDHLQSAYQEGIQQMAIPIIGQQYNTTDYFIMQGCKNTGSGSNYIISAGSIYHNNEWFLVDAATFTAGVGQTAVGTITTTFFTSANADPTTFTDGVAHNVNVIRKIVFSSGVSGSGDVDFNALKITGWGNRHFVGDTGEPGFLNSWGNELGWTPLSFRKNFSTNEVFIEGAIEKATWNGSPNNLFVITSGYSPPSPGVAQYFPIIASTSTGSLPAIFIIAVGGTASVQLYSTIVATTVSLTIHGIKYFSS